MRDERAASSQRPAETSHRIVRYLIGGWNTGLGALLALGGLVTSDVEYTALAAVSIVLGVGLLIGKRWAWALTIILTSLTILLMVTYSQSGYAWSVAIVQGLFLAGLIYASPAFSLPREG